MPERLGDCARAFTIDRLGDKGVGADMASWYFRGGFINQKAERCRFFCYFHDLFSMLITASRDNCWRSMENRPGVVSMATFAYSGINSLVSP